MMIFSFLKLEEFATRHKLLTEIGSVIIAKPVLEDLQEIREGGLNMGLST